MYKIKQNKSYEFSIDSKIDKRASKKVLYGDSNKEFRKEIIRLSKT